MIILAILIGIVIMSCGCIKNSQLNTTSVQILTPTTLFPTPGSPIQNQTTTNSVVVMPTDPVTPYYTDTIPVSLNNASIITKEQAWIYAVPYLDKQGLTDIQANEVEAKGPIETDIFGKHHELIYSFIISRCDSDNQSSRHIGNYGGLIFIDAKDGHIVGYSGIC
jgi:hypothetical protein